MSKKVLSLSNLVHCRGRVVLFGAGAFVTLALSGCAEDGATLATFTVDEDIADTRVVGGGLGNELPAGALPPLLLSVESDDEFETESLDVVNAIRITAIRLDIAPSSEDAATDVSENGMPDDFDFLDSLSLSIEADIDGERQSAELASIANTDPQLGPGSRRIDFLVNDVNILRFVEADGGYRIVSSAGGTVPADDVVFRGSVGYSVSIGVR